MPPSYAALATQSPPPPYAAAVEPSSHSARLTARLRASIKKGRGRYALGIVFLLGVVFIWVGSSFLMSFMFNESSYDKPIFVTYLNTASFTFYLIGTAFRALRPKRPASAVELTTAAAAEIPTSRSPLKASSDTCPSPQDKQSLESDTSFGDEGARAPSPTTDEVLVQEAPLDKLTTRETAKLSFTFCLLWFAANCSSNTALAHTTVSNATILCSTSGLFTLILGVLFRVERLTWLRVASVAASIGGVYLVTTGVQAPTDGPDSRNHLVGDILAVASAFFYGCYTILIKLKIDNEDRIHMPTFLGFVGLFNTFLLWPLFFLFHYTGVETFALPPTAIVWGMIALNALVGSFLSEYLWLLAVLMTSPLVVTLGISLTNPLALLGDIFLKGLVTTPIYWVGAALVMLGFLGSNW
ncbi:hypothetical protein IWQ60_002353 [Tieghemiomyces parasiticus]|uniref:EamA domain-containing protein n=1 Tax=Tieghemiomyces parasiticus TaxID=78921 RepID=A0A9W8AFA3_9FUNG|nr:hypothetical protein IWQ60_002353 [Tieghemiomyces parasiticus]